MKKLNIDGISLKILIEEYRRVFNNSRIIKIKQLSRDLIYIKLFPLNKYMVISTIPGINCIFSYSKAEYSPKNPFGFQMLLRKYIKGGIITEISQNSIDRTIILNIMKKNSVFFLIINLFGGAGSNIILCDKDMNILGDSKKRLESGEKYIFEKDKRKDPFIHNPDKVKDISILLSDYQGFSKKNAKRFSEMSLSFINFIDELRKEINIETLSELFIKYRMHNEISAFKKHLNSKIEKRLQSSEKKLKSIIKSIESNSISSKLRKEAKLLLTYQEKDSKKERVEIYDWEKQQNILISLNPAITIMENSENFFKKARRMDKELIRLKNLKENMEKEMDFYRKIKEKIDCTINYFDLKSIESMLIKKKNYRKKGYEKKQEKQKNKYYFIFITPNGRKLCIAKNSSCSEILTFRTAKPFDLFFHVQDSPGAHTVLMLKNRNDIPEEEDMLFAAKQAAKQSKLKNSPKVCVNYTAIKNVKKIPGKYTGSVILRSKKTIVVKL